MVNNMKNYRVYLSYHTEPINRDGAVTIEQVTLLIVAKDHSEAVKLALRYHDDFNGVNGLKLRNFNCYEQ